MVKLLRYFKIFIVSFLLLSLSSCAIHPKKFPYICFRKECVLGQLGIRAAINRGKVKRKEIKGSRKRRQIKRESKKNKTAIGNSYKPNVHETREEREQRRQDEKAAIELTEKQHQKTQDSLIVIAQANKKYIDPLAGQNQKEIKPVKGDSLVIYYPVNDDLLSLPDKERIKKYIDTINQTKYSKIHILGFTDNSGILSKERAQKVINYFIELGIPQSKLFMDDKGSKKPNYDNSTDDGRRLNRRVVVLVE